MANKAERVLVANMLAVMEKIESFAMRAEEGNINYKFLHEKYKGLRRDLRIAFDVDTI